MKDGYERVQPEEPLEVESPQPQKPQAPQEAAPAPWTPQRVLAGVAFCLVFGLLASAVAYNSIMNPDETTFVAARMVGATKVGAGILFWCAHCTCISLSICLCSLLSCRVARTHPFTRPVDCEETLLHDSFVRIFAKSTA